MSAIARIRKELLGLTQAELAAITGVTQATVSRWERGELFPNLRELALIREAAKAAKPDAWDDSLIFEPRSAA